MKKLFSFILALLNSLIFSITYGESYEPIEDTTTPVEVINDISGDSTLSDSVKFGYAVGNKVNGFYTTGSRDAYCMENSESVLTHSLKKTNYATLTDKDGNVFVEDSFDTFYTDLKGNTYFSSESKTKGRVNTTRLGVYYYECNVRDFNYCGDEFKVDKTYHVYGDRLYSQLSLLACEATTDLSEFGSIIKIPSADVTAIELRDSKGTHTDTEDFDIYTAEYVAFNIKNTGVVGFIVPSDGSTKKLEVTLNDGSYIVRQTANYESGTGINKYDETGGHSLNKVTFGFRIYTDSTHTFDGISRASFEERNPLTDITVEKSNCDAAYLGYDALRGAYTLSLQGTGSFAEAYNNPDRQYKVPVTIKCDDTDRDIFIRSFGKFGILEAARLLDDRGILSPLDVEVCKNFQGDGGEDFYSAKDYLYGDSFFPISLKSNQTLSFTLLNIFQNWGKVPLKQISSIEFHTSYYHLSTGCTETNCFSPYFTFGKDGWTLPDFRTASGIIWDSQPQFNSVGILKFVNYNRRILSLFEDDRTYSEYKSTVIDNSGLSYSDYTTKYVSDCDSYEYTLRHVEFPQKDENRTYFTVDIKFTKDMNFKNFRRDFDLFYFDGRMPKFENISFLDENNQSKTKEIDTTFRDVYYTLGKEAPYYTLHNVTDDTEHYIDEHFACNFGLIVKDLQIKKDGETQDIALAVRDSSTSSQSSASLTLDTKKISFKAGDSIKLDIILLPWGIGNEESADSVLTVREDSVLSPLKVTVVTGEVIEDTFVPRVRCTDGMAEFTVTGGRNNNAVRIDGFKSLECPDIFIKEGEEWKELSLASENGYDGYTVHYNPDGTYGFSFVFTTGSPDAEHSFKVCE